MLLVCMDRKDLIGKEVLIKYPDVDQFDETGELLEILDSGYILRDNKGRIIFAPESENTAKIVSMNGGADND